MIPAMLKHKPAEALPSLGWREWVRLPQLGLPWIKAKIDTGARTSALHAYDIEAFERDGVELVRFKMHPKQYSLEEEVEAEAELAGWRYVRSSHGKRTYRPVVITELEVLGRRLNIELTLIDRKKMKFRMLLGRRALAGHFLVDVSHSYLAGKHKRG